MWLTDIAPIQQVDEPNHIITIANQLYLDDKDGVIYLVPRKLISDNYTMPLCINKSKWDVRPSHLHDIGCKYHQLIKVNIPIEEIGYYLVDYCGNIRCGDIPKDKLEIVNVGFNKCNGLLYKAMVDSGIPKSICKLYRCGVELNINWLFTGKDNINIDNIYYNKLYT